MDLIKKHLKNIILILLCSIFVGSIIFKGNLGIIWDAVKNTDISILGLCLVIPCAYYMLDGINIFLYARIYKKDYRLHDGLIISFISPFFNGITPFASGGQFAQIYVFNSQGIDVAIGTSIMLMHFIVYQTVMVLYTLFILIFNMSFLRENYSNLWLLGYLGFGVNSVVLIALYIGSISNRFQKFIIKFVLSVGHRLQIVKDLEDAKDKYNQQMLRFREQTRLLYKFKGTLLIASLINVVGLTILYIVPFYCLRALNIPCDNLRLPMVIVVTAFVYMLTSFIPIPGASGGSEGFFTVMYSRLIGHNHASVCMLVWRFCTYYFMMFISAIIFILYEKLWKRKKS